LAQRSKVVSYGTGSNPSRPNWRHTKLSFTTCSGCSSLHAYTCWITSRRRITSTGPDGRPGFQRAWSAATQVRLDLLEQLLVFKQSIQFGQLRLEAHGQHRSQREQVDRRVPVA
jgi:hypothetical protein